MRKCAGSKWGWCYFEELPVLGLGGLGDCGAWKFLDL